MTEVTTLLIDLGLIILCATVLANLSKLFKQPLILGYVIAGILIGPSFLGLLSNGALIAGLSELGIAFLLFIVGLELNPRKLKQVGSVVTVTATVCVSLMALAGYFVASRYFEFVPSLYLGLILAFSSTMIVIKLISDAGRLNTLHGRLILGILLMQDILVILALPMLKGLSEFSYQFIAISLLKGLVLFLLAYLMGRYLLNKLLEFTASQSELLFVTALGICFIFIGLAHYFSFSIAIGAFLAGLAISSSPYSTEVVGRIVSLKDFFIVLFFVSLGSQLTKFNILEHWQLLLILIGLVVVLKPLIFFVMLKLFKQSNRTAFSTSFSLAQISEFSLIIAAQGLALGQLSSDLFSIVILLAIITITLTPYLISFNHSLFNMVSDKIEGLDRRIRNDHLEHLPKEMKDHIVVIGAHRMGGRIIETLRKKKANFAVLDFNPEIVKKLIKQKVHVMYGDYGNIHVLEALRLEEARMVVCTVNDVSDNLLLLNFAREKNKNIAVILTAKTTPDALLFYRNGANFVIYPAALSGQKVSDLLTHLDKRGLNKWGKVYFKELKSSQKKDPFIW